MTNPLSFELEDISYIIVREQNEVKKIFNILEKKYSSRKVLNSLKNGGLVIVSMKSIWNDL